MSGSERENGMPHYDRFPSQNDEFDEIEEVKEEYSLAPLFQRIHISGEDTTGVRNMICVTRTSVFGVSNQG